MWTGIRNTRQPLLRTPQNSYFPAVASGVAELVENNIAPPPSLHVVLTTVHTVAPYELRSTTLMICNANMNSLMESST